MDKHIIEQERKTKVVLSTEVLVVGGGIAGIAAAIASARHGKKVTLLEREYTLGGLATLGLITIYLPLCDGKGKQLVYGLGEELFKLSIKHGAEGRYPKAWLEGGSLEERTKSRYIAQFNPHLFALEAEALLKSLDVNILYGTLACATTTEDGYITSVIIENKSGRSAITTDSVIDCTGDADICKLAGAKTELYAAGNGLASWYYYFNGDEVKLKMFGLADVPPADRNEDASQGNEFKAAKVESLDQNFRYSGVDGLELSQAVIAAHEKMLTDILAHKKDNPLFVPVTISTVPLVRMSRRLSGVYTMDVTDEHKFIDDSIGMTGDWRKRGPAYEIPFSSLYGKEIKNLLAAGRNISVTDAMWDITRVIPPCAVTGQAAGTAAALANDFTKLDVSTLQEALVADGVKLHNT
jgi:hypothetical protein